MLIRTPTTKWCHVALSAEHGRKIFKIPTTARFCERAVRAACRNRGWVVDAVVARPDGFQLLVRVPRKLSRQRLVAVVGTVVRHALRRAGVVPAWSRHVFTRPPWCAVLTNAAAVGAVRQYLRSQRAARRTSSVWGSTKSSSVGA